MERLADTEMDPVALAAETDAAWQLVEELRAENARLERIIAQKHSTIQDLYEDLKKARGIK